MDHVYLIKYISGKTLSECFDSQHGPNQITAYNRFMERRPDARHVKIKSKTGVWINHYV